MTENSSFSEADNVPKIVHLKSNLKTEHKVSFSPSKHKINGIYKWISDVSSSEESETAKIMKDHDLLKNNETMDCTIDNVSNRNRNLVYQKEHKTKETQKDFIKEIEQLSYCKDQAFGTEHNWKDKIIDDPKNILTEINLNEKHSKTTSDREEGELSPDSSSRSLRIETSYQLNKSKVFKTEFQKLQNSAEKEFEHSQTNEAFLIEVLRKEKPDFSGLKYLTQRMENKVFGTIKRGNKNYNFRKNDFKMPSCSLITDKKFNSSWSKTKQNVVNPFKKLTYEVKVPNYQESNTEQSNETDQKNVFSNNYCTKIGMRNENTKTLHELNKSNSSERKKFTNQSCFDKKGFYHQHQKLFRKIYSKSHRDASKKFTHRKSRINEKHLEQERENKEVSRAIEKNRIQTLFQRQMNIINQCVIPQKRKNQITLKEDEKLCKRDRKCDFQIEQKFEECEKSLKPKEVQTLEDMEQFLHFLRTNKEQKCRKNIQTKDKIINRDAISAGKFDNTVVKCLQINDIEKCSNFGIPKNNFVKSEIGEPFEINNGERKLRCEDGSRKPQLLNSKELNNLNPNNIKYFASQKEEKNINENKQLRHNVENGILTNNKSAKKSENPNIISRPQYSFDKMQNKKWIQTENLNDQNTGGNKLSVLVDIKRKTKDKMKKIGNEPNAISSSERNRSQKSLIKGLKLENTFILVDEKLGIIDSKFYLTKKGNQFYLKRALPKERIKLNGKRKQNPVENCSQLKGSVISTSAETRGEFHCFSDDRKIEETTLGEMESFLRQLRLRKKLISESSRFDSESHACRVTLLDSFRAERKAKLMACMPDNPKKTARLLEDLEKRGGQPRVLSEVEARKQELIQILRAETDAIIFANKSLSGWKRAIVSTTAADVRRRSNVTDKKNESEPNKSIAFTWKKLRLENKNMANIGDESLKSKISTESQRILNAMKTKLKAKQSNAIFKSN